MTSSPGFYIPEEILVGNILERLPSKSLIRFRCVCKQWRDIIGSSSFIRAHHDRNLTSRPSKDNNYVLAFNLDYGEIRQYCLLSKEVVESQVLRSVVLVTTEEVWERRLRFTRPWFDNNTINIHGSSNGLVCFSSYRNPICIWNPSIGKSRIVTSPPKDKNSYYIAGERTLLSLTFGFHPQSNDYKAVRILFNDNAAGPLLEVEIYTLSTNSWKRINVRATSRLLSLLKSRGLCKFFASAFLNGIVYFLLDKDSEYKMVSIDTVSEECKEVMVPEYIFSGGRINNPRIRVFKESICICIVHYGISGHGIIDMWIMKDQSFQKIHSVTTPEYSFLLGFSRDHDGLVLKKNRSNGLVIILYNLASKQFSNTGIWLRKDEPKPVNIPGAFKYILCEPCYAGVYTESLVLLDD